MSKGGSFGPGLFGVGSTLDVELGVVLKDAGFLGVSFVVGFFLLRFGIAKFFVFLFA